MEANVTALTLKLKDSRIGAFWIKYRNRAWFIPSIAIGICMIVSLLVDMHESATATPTPASPYAGIDTFIPAGYVLLPIEVQNLDSLDSLIGQYGVVDLYTPGDSEPLAKGLKIVRSPKNPSEFSVLVPESRSAALIRAEDKPFLVVVQNPKDARSEFRKAATPSRIVIEN